jgi:signal transduction histidine kinase/ActR/RegA family two-component response regulator
VSETLAKLASGQSVNYSEKDNNQRADGTLISCQWYNVPIMDADGYTESILCMAEDVTERLRAEEELVRAKRLESAGQLAGQIAHDFNNLLGPLIAYPEMIGMMIKPDPKVSELLEDMTSAAEQIAEINQDLLTLGRRGHYNVGMLDLNRTISDTLRPLTRDDGPAVTFRPAEDLPAVKGGRAQITRILTNLVINAVEATTDAGTITVSTTAVMLAEPVGVYAIIPPGDYVRVDVTDTGTGIEDDTLEHIFEAFFTTKQTDRRRGSGLGLSVVHAVMEDHDGFIDVQSVPGEGTTFSLYFPAANGEAIEEKTDLSIGYPTGHGKTVLVVDDDPIQARIAFTMLDKLGYKVMTAGSGEEAVALIAEHPHDVVLLDMVMDGMNGAETLRAIKELYPDQIALILSGYAPNEQVAETKRLGAREFLAKPINVATIANAMYNALHTEQPEAAQT